MSADTLPPVPDRSHWSRASEWSRWAGSWYLFLPDERQYVRTSAVTVRPVEVTTARGSTRRAWTASVRHGQNHYTTDPCRTRDAAARAVLLAAGVTSHEVAA